MRAEPSALPRVTHPARMGRLCSPTTAEAPEEGLPG